MRHARYPAPPRQSVLRRTHPQGFAWAAAVAGLVYFIAQGGGHALVPTHIDWLQRNDWSQHYLGWAFWRRAPWSWPLGVLTELGRPVGTTVAYTDANPLISFALRPWARWLPEPFQFIGPFLGACFAAQGYVGARLSYALGARGLQTWLAGCLFVTAPVLLQRIDHDTLMAHWLILASIARIYAPVATSARREFGAVLALVAVAILTHPYLTAMVLPLLAVAIARQGSPAGCLGPRRAWALAALCTCVLGAAAWALGYIGRPESSAADGFGFFAADLTALVNPMGWSRLLPSLPAHRGQRWEGMGYLGAGVLALCGVAAVAQALRRPKIRRPYTLMALAICALGAWAFALGDYWAWQGQPRWDLRAAYAPWAGICQMLRASGRFIWIVVYLAMSAAIAGVVNNLPRRAATWALAAALALQLVDVRPQDVRARLTTDPHVAMGAAPWQLLRHDYAHLVLLPPHFHGSDVQCNPRGYRDKIEMPPGFLAAASGLSINSSYVARADRNAVIAYCKALQKEVGAGLIDGQTVYLVDPSMAGLVAASGVAMTCWHADGYTGCVRADRPTQVTAWVARTQAQTDVTGRAYLPGGKAMGRVP